MKGCVIMRQNFRTFTLSMYFKRKLDLDCEISSSALYAFCVIFRIITAKSFLPANVHSQLSSFEQFCKFLVKYCENSIKIRENSRKFVKIRKN